MAETKVHQMDWQQVVMNGGPPCFALLDDENGWYCGRAQRWEGHDYEHRFVPLQDMVAVIYRNAITQAIQIVSELPINNNVQNFTRATAFKAAAIEALEGRIK